MEKALKGTLGILPGLGLSLLIAVWAKSIENILPVHIIGGSVIALFTGMAINYFFKIPCLKSGLKFTSKRVLKLAIVLLGASLSVGVVLEIGRLSLTVMVFTLLTCFGGGYFIGKALGLGWKLSNLISAGTGICGGSAIAAIAPVIDAEDSDIAIAISATFLFDMAMIVVFPLLGRWMGLSDMAYGLWAGTAVNDTSSVVAAGFAFSEAAGDFATMVKLTRTLSIIPVVVIFAMINIRLERKAHIPGTEGDTIRGRVNFFKLMPWFIVFFVLLAVINSIGLIPAGVSSASKELSKFLMIAALAAIGLSTDIKDMKKSGFAPMVHGFIISALVVIVAIAVEYFMGIV